MVSEERRCVDCAFCGTERDVCVHPATRFSDLRRNRCEGELCGPEGRLWSSRVASAYTPAQPSPPPAPAATIGAAEDNGAIRQFATGATRDTSVNKPDFDGYLSPYVLEAFGAYMLEHQKQSDGTLRPGDNWQKGIPPEVYRKSAFRHFLAFWKHARLGDHDTAARDALALLFNVQGWLHEHLKAKEARS